MQTIPMVLVILCKTYLFRYLDNVFPDMFIPIKGKCVAHGLLKYSDLQDPAYLAETLSQTRALIPRARIWPTWFLV
jgi:hypothetical protein